MKLEIKMFEDLCFRRIFCHYSSTIAGIVESMLRVCCMLGIAVELIVVGQVELRFGQFVVEIE